MKRASLVAAVAAAGLVVVPIAAAKTWFENVRGKQFTIGSVVTTRIPGCPVPCPPQGTRVSLAPGRTSVRPLRRLGIVDRSGRLRFRIPSVAPGRYHLVADGRVVSDVFAIARAR